MCVCVYYVITIDCWLLENCGYSSTYVCIGLQELNLTHNLLSTWDEVAAITAGLHQLHSFNISENRLAPPPNPSAELSSAFGNIRTLFVNKMNLEWIEVMY